MSDICLEMEHVHKTYMRREGKKKIKIHALDDVSFSLNKNEFLGIIGPSGCGKSTVIKILLGIAKADSGKYNVHGTVGFVGQDPYTSLSASMEVEKIVAEPLIFSHRERRYKNCEDRVRKAMSDVHMDYDKYVGRFPHQLSGGERQRIGIARALILEPEVLIMDEPTSMLDQAVKQEICDIISEVSLQEGRSLLMVTHDITMASKMCTQLCVMQDGRLIENGTTDEILKNPKEELTKNLITIGTDVKIYWKESYDV